MGDLWTKTLPTEAGWYWWRPMLNVMEPQVFRVVRSPKLFVLTPAGHVGVDIIGGEWGPRVMRSEGAPVVLQGEPVCAAGPDVCADDGGAVCGW